MGPAAAGVLCIDDDPDILRWQRRCLEARWPVRTAPDGARALDLAAVEPPLVVVCDQDMPGMDGLTLLARLRESHPEAIRLLLTGGGDLEVAVEAINENLVFRFLTKPCGVDRLVRMVADGVEQHRLRAAERVLLEETLRGCVKALVDILAAVSPPAFGRACRARQSVEAMARLCGRGLDWRTEMAALLSQLGGVILPPHILEKLEDPHRLSKFEKELVNRIPGVSARLIAGIPRLEEVRAILSALEVRADGGGKTPEMESLDLPWEARALRVALAADELQSRGVPAELVGSWLRRRAGSFDPVLIEAWHACRVTEPGALPTREVAWDELREGMRLAADVTTQNGLVIVARGQELTESILLRLQNFAIRDGLPERISIERPEAAALNSAAS